MREASSLNSVLARDLQGVYLNPDDIEKEMRRDGFLDLTAYGLATATKEAIEFISKSDFLKKSHPGLPTAELKAIGPRLELGNVPADSYLASVLTDFMREKLMEQRVSFTFETVMSHEGKVEVLRKAQHLGYRTYFYYVATEDPLINVSRVENRVKTGGHPVASDKIQQRYYRSLELLISAIRSTNRAYIFDNSSEGRDRTWVAEITDGRNLEVISGPTPAWFQRYVLEHFNSSD